MFNELEQTVKSHQTKGLLQLRWLPAGSGWARLGLPSEAKRSREFGRGERLVVLPWSRDLGLVRGTGYFPLSRAGVFKPF